MNRTTRKPAKFSGKRVQNPVSFKPCKPVAEMLALELRGKGWGEKTSLLDRCIVKTLGVKYPDQAERYRIMQLAEQERAA